MADFDVVVAGSGLAGLTAALFSARHGHSTVVLGTIPGGALLSVSKIDDFPGFADGTAGFDLCPTLQGQAMEAGASFRPSEIEGLTRRGDEWIVSAGEGELSARAVIAATGRTPARLGVPGEERLLGRGISDCASCDGPIHRGGVVGVVGGGDSALLEALELAEFAERVLLFHRGSELDGQAVYRDRVPAEHKIAVQLESEVVEVLGEDRVSGVVVRDASGATSEVALSGLFVYVGGVPVSSYLQGVVELDELGRVATDGWLRTSAPGLFAAGSIRAESSQQAVAAAGDGATAAVAAHRYLTAQDRAALAAPASAS